MMLVNKGKLVGLSLEQVEKDKEILGFQFLSVLYCIIQTWDKENQAKNSTMKDKDKGLIKEAYNAIYNDTHGLAIQIDLINLLYNNKRKATRHKDFLYVSELVEKYFANLRSMYDYLARISCLSVNPVVYGQINFNSFNKLIEAVEKEKNKEMIPERLREVVISAKEHFNYIRKVRDGIIHNGKDIGAPITKDDGYYLLIPQNNGEAILQPLLSYLSELTKRFFSIADEISSILYEEYNIRYGQVPFAYVALSGMCIPSFIEFLEVNESKTSY